MGKSIRKYRKNREYDYIEPPATASAYDYHDNKSASVHHGVVADNDLLTSPREFVPLDDLAPGSTPPYIVLMQLTLTCVGASVVVMPYVFLQAGFVMTIFMVLLFALVTYYSTFCLVHLGVAHGIYSFPGLAKLAFGPRGALAVGILQILASMGLITTYLMVLYQDFPVLLGQIFQFNADATGWPVITNNNIVSKLLASRFWSTEFLTMFVVLPYCLMAHSYQKLHITSSITTVLLLLTALSVMAKASSLHDTNAPTASQGYSRDYLVVPATICQAFGTMASAFTCQHHTFHAFYALRNRTLATFARLLLLAMMIIVFLVYSIGIGGYVSFLSNTKPDIFQSYDLRDPEQRGVRIFWVLVPICALWCIPPEIIATRHSVMFLSRASHQDDEKPDVLFRAQPPTKPVDPSKAAAAAILYDAEKQPTACTGNHSCQWIPHLLTCVSLVVFGQVASFFVFNIATVLSVVGGLSAITLSFVLPAACHLKLSFGGDKQDEGNWFFATFLPCFSLLIGVVSAIACMLANLIAAFS